MNKPKANEYHTYESLNAAWRLWAKSKQGKSLELQTIYADGSFDSEIIESHQVEVFYTNRFLGYDTKAENTLSVVVDSNKFADNVYSDMQPLSKAGMIKAYKAWLTSRNIGFKSVVGVLINNYKAA